MRLHGVDLVLVVAVVLLSTLTVGAQDVPGDLVFADPFEPDVVVEGWYMVRQNTAVADILGPIEDGVDGGSALVILTNTPANATLNNLQWSNEFPKPDGSSEFPWQIHFWIRVKVVPYTVRPIIAMSADPWSGVSTEVTIETADEWFLVDVTLDPADFLTSDPLLFIIHMGNPGDEYGENEVWLDDLKVYLLNRETKVNGWMIF
ncbi:MAG: hypothetical protein C4527_11445 [Candidatus Omnitrophota bacterium]|jgi:hypothetical protein|nr:MAG: hypothetical protein C4527_11445 [Candidatus Omnitrophota bacterium]